MESAVAALHHRHGSAHPQGLTIVWHSEFKEASVILLVARDDDKHFCTEMPSRVSPKSMLFGPGTPHAGSN